MICLVTKGLTLSNMRRSSTLETYSYNRIIITTIIKKIGGLVRGMRAVDGKLLSNL